MYLLYIITQVTARYYIAMLQDVWHTCVPLLLIGYVVERYFGGGSDLNDVITEFIFLLCG